MNESVNQKIARFVPKLKHFCTTTALDTRIATVVGIVIYSYKICYEKLPNKLITCHNNKHLVYDCIVRIRLTKELNKVLKLKQEYMRKRTHGKDTKAKSEIPEERIDKARKLGSYGAAICF